MKQILLLMLITSIAATAIAQGDVPRQSPSYEAANWNTWLLNDSQKIVVSPPPAGPQSKAELQSVRQRVANVDDKKMREIKYWDSGAPSYRWNQILPLLVDQKPQSMLRIPASWMNLAIYDATVLAWKEKIKYKRSRPNGLDRSIKTIISGPATYSYPCEHSVTASAAGNVLAYFFPAKADSILQMAHAASQSRIDAGVQFPSDVEAGWKLGEEVAKQIIEKAKNDGSTAKWTGPINKDPKKWTGKYAMGLTLSLLSPIVIRSADQFRPGPPPDFESEMKELKNFEQTFNSRATAFYWASNGNTWNELAGQKMFEYRMADDAPAAARIYTLLHISYHDMAIAIFDAKYTYWGIRPDQYDSTYKPLIKTPPFPGYPSGHAAAGAASSAVLEYFFPADAKEFRQLAQDCADSRFYAGIHFRSDNETALVMGKAIGKYIVETWMGKEEGLVGRNR